MRREDELLDMVRGRDPMAQAGPPIPGQGPPGMPPMQGDPMQGDMMQEEQMLPMEPPMEGGADQMLDGALPETGRVAGIEGGTVHIVDENGTELQVPIEDLPFPPDVGMELVRAEVVSVEGDTMTAQISTTGETMTLPMDMLQTEFAPGEYFWMPTPPGAPPEESEFEQVIGETLL